ncbi:MAG: branched-chain amino acid ABC transporter permease [Devosia sp.]
MNLGGLGARGLLLYAGFAIVLLLVGLWQGPTSVALILAQALAYSLLALGLNIQFGYGGLFNFGIMGFVMVGGFATVFVSAERNDAFWVSDGPLLLGRAALAFAAGALLVWGARHVDRLGIRGAGRGVCVVLAWVVGYVVYRSQIDPAAASIEATSGWVGGLGLNPVLGWAFGGVLAGIIAFIVGRIALGLRTDYLAIATIGIAEIIRALIKNMDWLTRGTLTVTPLPWPTPRPQELQAIGVGIQESFTYARLGFAAVVAIVLVAVFILISRAYRAPWGRMMRAIRDNHIAAASMGKNVTARQLEIFVLGSILMGVSGAILATFNQIFDPGGYLQVNHNFLIWVMVIVGGAGNNWGTLLGALLIYLVWVISDPASQFLLNNLSDWASSLGWGTIPEIDSRASQMRVFVLGIVICLVLRYAPRGLLPEVIRRSD